MLNREESSESVCGGCWGFGIVCLANYKDELEIQEPSLEKSLCISEKIYFGGKVLLALLCEMIY